MQAGFSKVSILPDQPTSLAGYGTSEPRIFDHVRDEIHSRAMAVSDGDTGVVWVQGDYLTPTERLAIAVRVRARKLGLPSTVDIVLHAQHTHSSIGNFWNHPIAQKVCGPFRPEVFDFLAGRLAEAAVKAWEARQPAKMAVTQVDLPGLMTNRRRRDGPLDEMLTVMRFDTAKGKPLAAIVHFTGHPVIVSERDFTAVSADFPGRVMAALEKEYPTTIYIDGAVGGLSPIWPAPEMDVDVHLSAMAEPIIAAAGPLIDGLKTRKEPVAFSRQTAVLPPPAAHPMPDAWAALEIPLKPVLAWWVKLGQQGRLNVRRTDVTALRLGETALVGQPSDFGVGCGLQTRKAGKPVHLTALPCSHCDDYVGYMHPEAEMRIKPIKGDGFDEGFRYMTIYENLMSFYGRKAYVKIADAERRALHAVAGV
ncbi:MAG: neutral/alkaline non-lysosomal ceramidase N-terminal domain-containing protein [Deltaproteobacteria bacterium]|nr:neutral/alkaline non-lysosomal ceramidase N-terminal domain-containing protein [Deltaproteobacteria bacterium]